MVRRRAQFDMCEWGRNGSGPVFALQSSMFSPTSFLTFLRPPPYVFIISLHGSASLCLYLAYTPPRNTDHMSKGQSKNTVSSSLSAPPPVSPLSKTASQASCTFLGDSQGAYDVQGEGHVTTSEDYFMVALLAIGHLCCKATVL